MRAASGESGTVVRPSRLPQGQESGNVKLQRLEARGPPRKPTRAGALNPHGRSRARAGGSLSGDGPMTAFHGCPPSLFLP